ncbi:hypothetical protein EIP86_002239 [Pleurotus ostreatoroseus]|nr:hypothetical protein EIP86_002239 [Pleurotus ostreatoroseus]
MVDVSLKEPTKRIATARGRIIVPKVAYDLIVEPRDSYSDGNPSMSTSTPSPLDKATSKVRSKGDVLTVAQLAAIMGCKRTADLIPLCHPLQLSRVSVELLPEASRGTQANIDDDDDSCSVQEADVAPTPPSQARLQYSILCSATVTCEGKTGVEMEALTAVSVGLLTVWDMLKAVAGREMIICDIVVVEKRGGKGGDFVRS